MPLDVAAIRAGLADRLRTIAGLRVSEYEPDTVNTPHAWVTLSDPFMPEPHEAFKDGLAQVEFTVRIAVSDGAGFARAQAALDGFVSSGTGMASSVIDAVMGDQTLGGALPGHSCRVVEVSGIRQLELAGGVSYVGIEIPIRAYCPRT